MDSVTDEGAVEEIKGKDLSVYVPEKVRKPGEIGFALLGTMFGMLGYYFAMGMTSGSYSAPSVFPKIASSLIVIFGLTCLAKAFVKDKPAQSETVFHYLLPKDVIFMLMMLVVYCIVMPYAGFISSSYVFMVVGMIYLHKGKKIAQSIFISAGALAALVVVFRYIFLVILP